MGPDVRKTCICCVCTTKAKTSLCESEFSVWKVAIGKISFFKLVSLQLRRMVLNFAMLETLKTGFVTMRPLLGHQPIHVGSQFVFLEINF